MKPMASAGEKAGKYLTLRIGNEEYRLEILKVREIIGLTDITRMPRAPQFERGVINFRGKLNFVVDSVSEVLDIQAEEIEETPEFGGGVDTRFILGKAKGDAKILPDIDKVLTEEDIAQIYQV